jgi:hypothetical protein
MAHDTFIDMESNAMMIRYLARMLLVLLVTAAFGCGGGGGGGGGGVGGGGTTPPANPTKATLTLSMPSLPAGTLVGAVQFTITLPQGVSPAVFSGNDASGSITLIGGGINLQGFSETNYNSTNNTITFAGATTTSFGTGNFAIVNCVIASGTTVTASNFSISNQLVIDSSGNTISTTINIAVQLS